jgi:hypothetical protein
LRQRKNAFILASVGTFWRYFTELSKRLNYLEFVIVGNLLLPADAASLDELSIIHFSAWDR